LFENTKIKVEDKYETLFYILFYKVFIQPLKTEVNMNNTMSVTFFGVRGSHPVPDVRMLKYGGRTSSVMFQKEKNGVIIPLFIDAGLGLIEAGKKIIPDIFSGRCIPRLNLFFTHYHPDHTEGFTFFEPNFLPQIEMNLFGMSTAKKDIGMVLRDKMAQPLYPIEYKDLKSTRHHHVISDGETFYIDTDGKVSSQLPQDAVYKIQVMQAFAPSHPQQGAVYYRISDIDTGVSTACIWDIESRYGGDQRVIAFAKDALVMIHDTQYTDDEYHSEKMVVQGFGHSTFSMAVDNAVKAGVKRLIPFHYNPSHTDQKLDEIMASIDSKGLEITPSQEGLQIIL
jgi:ribonuclease BN (tRNA processing enzyme)